LGTIEDIRWADNLRDFLSVFAVIAIYCGIFLALPLGIVLLLALLFVPGSWDAVSRWVRSGSSQKGNAAGGLSTSQLVILWCGTIAAEGLCFVWTVVSGSLGPAILGVILLTVLLAISVRPSPSANKRAVAAAVAALLGLIVLLPAGFFVFEGVPGSGNKGLIEPKQVEISDLHWFRPSYPGVIGLSATIKNASPFELSTIDLKLTVEEPGRSPESLSDTIRVDLAPGKGRTVTHYFGRPLLGRDIHNFLFLKPAFNAAAILSWKITGTTTGSALL
jgi:hypothetical protein